MKSNLIWPVWGQRRFPLPGLAPVLAGWLQAQSLTFFGQGPTFGLLQVLSLAWLAHGLIRVAESDLPRRTRALLGGAQGGLFALAWLGGTFWWLHVSMHVYGGLNSVLAALAVLALAAGLGLYYALAAALWSSMARPLSRPALSAFSFAAFWTLAEAMRGQLFTGFPWGAGGYAHVDSWLSVWAPWWGVYGVGALASWMAVALAQALTRMPALGSGTVRRWSEALRPLLGPAALVLVSGALCLWPVSWTTSAGRMHVELLQGNISQDQKFDAEGGVRDALIWYGQKLQASRAPLVMAPETALPVPPQGLPPVYWQGLQQRFAQSQQLALIGLPLGDAQRGYTNSALALGPAMDRRPGHRYDKHHLVPFGEFVPWGFGWFVRSLNIPLGDFGRGPLIPAVLEWQGQRIAPHICYEDLFGEELAARFVREATAPTVLANLSNIAWFGDTEAIDQHLHIARMRAMEMQRPVLRATNTGATAIIDAEGQVQDLLPRHTRGVLEGEFEGRNGLTPYARWVAWLGLWPLWLLALAVCALDWRIRGRGQ